MNKYLMGIDNGGTYIKAAIFDVKGNQIALSKVAAPTLDRGSGYKERDMKELWELNCQCIRNVIAESKLHPESILGVSICGHGKGLYLLGENSSYIYNGILSTDQRAWEYEKILSKRKDEELYKLTMQEPMACQPMCLLMWMKDHEPDVYQKIHWVLSVKDFIRFKLTDEIYTEYTDCSGSGLMNLKTKKYDQTILEAYNLSELSAKLPPILHSTDQAGRITAEAAAQTGLAEGTLVSAGLFDVDACNLACGLINEKQLCAIAGTWGINTIISKEPLLEHKIKLNSLYCIKDTFLIEESSPASAGNLEWFIQHWLKNIENKYDYINELVNSTHPEESKIIFLPFMYGSISNPPGFGTFVGLTSHDEMRHIFRAIYEGITFMHVYHIQKLLKYRNVPKSIRLAGGIVHSDPWVQMFADSLNIKVETIEGDELGAKGAAITAGVAAGLYENLEAALEQVVHTKRIYIPNTDYIEIYKQKIQRFYHLLDTLDVFWEAMTVD